MFFHVFPRIDISSIIFDLCISGNEAKMPMFQDALFPKHDSYIITTIWNPHRSCVAGDPDGRDSPTVRLRRLCTALTNWAGMYSQKMSCVRNRPKDLTKKQFMSTRFGCLDVSYGRVRVLLPIRQGSGISHGALCHTHINISQGVPCQQQQQQQQCNLKLADKTPRVGTKIAIWNHVQLFNFNNWNNPFNPPAP